MSSSPNPKAVLPLLAALSLAVSLSGCELAKGIFKAGVWSGVIIVVLAVALFAGIASMFRRA
jgi:hypothetical protein